VSGTFAGIGHKGGIGQYQDDLGSGAGAAHRRQTGGSVCARQPWWTINRHLEQMGNGRAVRTAQMPRSSFRHTPQRNAMDAFNIGAAFSG